MDDQDIKEINYILTSVSDERIPVHINVRNNEILFIKGEYDTKQFKLLCSQVFCRLEQYGFNNPYHNKNAFRFGNDNPLPFNDIECVEIGYWMLIC